MRLGHKEPPNKLTRDLTGHNESCSLTDAYRFRLRSSGIPRIPPHASLNEVSALSSFLIQLQAACQFIAATLYDTLRMRSEGEFIKNSITLLRRTTQRLFPNKTGRISYISTSDRGIPIKYFVRRLKTVNRKRSVFAPDAYMYGCKKYKKAQGVGKVGGDEQCSLFDCRSFYWKERA